MTERANVVGKHMGCRLKYGIRGVRTQGGVGFMQSRYLVALGAVLGGLGLVFLAVSHLPPTAASGLAQAQTTPYAEVVTVRGSAYACGQSRDCATPASKGARLYVSGEARTGADGVSDL